MHAASTTCETRGWHVEFHETYSDFPRNTIRPRGTTLVDGELPGNLWDWNTGIYETWNQEITPLIEQPRACVQDAIPIFGCPSDPRVPDCEFTWQGSHAG